MDLNSSSDEYEEDQSPSQPSSHVTTGGADGDVDNWAQCDRCSKWRRVPAVTFPLPTRWYCEMNPSCGPWSCAVPEAAEDADAIEVVAADGCFVVERLLAKRRRLRQVQYLVSTRGWVIQSAQPSATESLAPPNVAG